MAKKIGAGALHKAVERKASTDGVAVARSKKWVAATALFQLCNVAAAKGSIDGYCVKGGFSVELRHPSHARTSEDIDLIIGGAAPPIELLDRVISEQWADFEFIRKKTETRPHSIRVELQVRFNNVDWCTLKIDVLDDKYYTAEQVEPPDLAQFGLPSPSTVPCLSRPQQLAQWIHSITKPEIEGKRPDRARNILDAYLSDTLSPCSDADVVAAAQELFDREGTHSWPPAIDLPEGWLVTLNEWVLELELDLSAADLVETFHRYMSRLLGVTVQMAFDYRFYVLTYAATQKPLASDDTIPELSDVFSNDVNLAGLRRAIEDGFRIAQLLQYDTVRGVIAMLERPASD